MKLLKNNFFFDSRWTAVMLQDFLHAIGFKEVEIHFGQNFHGEQGWFCDSVMQTDFDEQIEEYVSAVIATAGSKPSLDSFKILQKTLDKKSSLTEINKVVSKLEEGDFELADDDITGQVDGFDVVANIILDEPAGKKHTLLIEVDVKGKSYDHRETDGPHGRTLYCERGFNCTSVSPKGLKIDKVEVPLSSEKLKKVLQDILDDVDAKEGFSGSVMY